MSAGKTAKCWQYKSYISCDETAACDLVATWAFYRYGRVNVAGNCELHDLFIVIEWLVMDKAKRWFNDFLFASVDTYFMRSKSFAERLFVIANHEDHLRVM